MLTNHSLFGGIRRMLWCVLLLLILLLENQSSQAAQRQQRPSQKTHYSSRIRGLQQQQQQIAHVNTDIHNKDASSPSLNFLPTAAPTVKIQDVVIRINMPKVHAPDPKETTTVVQQGANDSTVTDEWTRYRERSRPTIPSGMTTPSSAPISAIKNTPTLNHHHQEEEKEILLNISKANDDLEYVIVVIQSVAVDLQSNRNTIMNVEDISIFEQVCETEFLPLYLPRVYNATTAATTTTNYTDIKCIVVDQRMINRSLVDDDSRILQEGEHQPQQQQQQIANVRLDSDSLSTLLQILSTVDFLPAEYSFTDIVAQTFREYSYAFQEQLSQQTDYFFVSKQVETIIPDGLKQEEESPETSANNNSLPVAAKVGIGITGGFALAAALFLFGQRMSRRSGNKNEQTISPAIAPVESLVSCIEPNERGQVVSNKQHHIIEEDEGEEMTIDILDDANTNAVNDDTPSQVFRRIMNETSKDPMTSCSIGDSNKSKPVEIISVGLRSSASDDISSVSQASTIGSANNSSDNNNNPFKVSVESSHSCVGAFLAQLEEIHPAKSTRRDEEAAGGYPIPQIRDHSSNQFSNDSSALFGSGRDIVPATTGSMLSLEWYSLADSLSSVAGLTTKATRNLSSMLGDLTTAGDSASTDDNIVFLDSVETTLSGVIENESQHGNDNNDAKEAL